MSPPYAGYGAGGFGAGLYGAGSPAPLVLIDAFATSENVVQLQFNFPVYLSTLRDAPDASDPSHFTFTAVPSTVGYDGSPARPVAPATIAYTDPAPTGFLLGQCLDVTLDRAMTPYPAQYMVGVTGLLSSDQISPLTVPSMAMFYGLYRQLVQPSLTTTVPARDFANPQSAIGATSMPNPSIASLGVFGAGEDGDYAIESGDVSYKKRVYRRMSTRKGGFIFLPPDYGVGLPYQIKQLGTPVRRQTIAADIELQVAQEPETLQVKAQLLTPIPGMVRVNLFARTRGTNTAQKLSATFKGS
jgi:hypothetical protein